MTEGRGRRRWALAAAVLVLVALRLFVVEPVRVRTSSMAPTLQAGDVVLVLRQAHPEIGDVVLLEEPDGDGRRHVKRLVAAGGQEVELSRGQLYVDGRAVAAGDPPPRAPVTWVDADCGVHQETPVLERVGVASWTVLPGGQHDRETVPDGQVWLLGDNRGASSDSRHWGAVDASWLRGVIWGVVWSGSQCSGRQSNRIGPLPESEGGPDEEPPR